MRRRCRSTFCMSQNGRKRVMLPTYFRVTASDCAALTRQKYNYMYVALPNFSWSLFSEQKSKASTNEKLNLATKAGDLSVREIELTRKKTNSQSLELTSLLLRGSNATIASFPFLFTREIEIQRERNDAGSQYRCGRVGRGILPPSIPHAPLTYTKNYLKCSFSHFSTRVHGPTDRPTDGPTDGQSLLQSCVSATKNEKQNE